MKKFIPLLMTYALISGCSTTQLAEQQSSTNVERYKVFQVFDGGNLANACETKYSHESCYGLTVLIPSNVVKTTYDDMIITLKNPKVVETYTYSNMLGIEKTVPVLSGTVQ